MDEMGSDELHEAAKANMERLRRPITHTTTVLNNPLGLYILCTLMHL